MREFPTEDTLQFLVGLTVSQVVLQPYSVDINFVDFTSLVIEHRLQFIDACGNKEFLEIQEGINLTRLHKIVRSSITAIAREPYCLSLTFDNKHTLSIFSEDGYLESGHINRSGDVIVF